MAIAPAELPVIKAAGGILLRSTPRGDEVMIVYRNRYQDWTLPKGKLKDGESFPEAALREVEEETGCSCRLGAYLGAISYAYNGVPKVVMFWKMSVIEEKPVATSEEIAEAVWMPVSPAIERMTHAQEKSLLVRVAAVAAPRPVSPPPAATESVEIVPQPSQAETPPPPIFAQYAPPAKDSSVADRAAHERLSRELEAFRVELAFLERRSLEPDKSWVVAARDHLSNCKSCLELGDIEGGLEELRAARRYCVLGLNPPELAARAQVVREEARKINSWRSAGIQRLLALPDEKLTPARLADAMALRDEEIVDQYYTGKIAAKRLQVLMLVCGLGVAVLLALMLVGGWIEVIAPVLVFGLLGASVCAAQNLIHGKSEQRAPSLSVMLAPVLFGAVVSLAGYAVHQYLFFMLDPGPAYRNSLFIMAFLFGSLGQLMLARFTGPSRRRPPATPA